MKAVIIGTGVMGRRHIGIAQRAGFDVVGIADPLPESLQKAKAGKAFLLEYMAAARVSAAYVSEYEKLMTQ